MPEEYCPICDSGMVSNLGKDGNAVKVRCRSCGHEFIAVTPEYVNELIAAYYEEETSLIF